MTTILVPMDLSPASALGLEYGRKLAVREPLVLVLLHVIAHVPELPPESDFNRSFNVPEYRRLLQDDALKQLEALAKGLEEVQGERRVMVTSGKPVDEIVRVADELGAELIVMSTHGRQGFDRILQGSVTEHVVRLAPCPVLCVRPRQGAG